MCVYMCVYILICMCGHAYINTYIQMCVLYSKRATNLTPSLRTVLVLTHCPNPVSRRPQVQPRSLQASTASPASSLLPCRQRAPVPEPDQSSATSRQRHRPPSPAPTPQRWVLKAAVCGTFLSAASVRSELRRWEFYRCW